MLILVNYTAFENIDNGASYSHFRLQTFALFGKEVCFFTHSCQILLEMNEIYKFYSVFQADSCNFTAFENIDNEASYSHFRLQKFALFGKEVCFFTHSCQILIEMNEIYKFYSVFHADSCELYSIRKY